MSHTNRFTGNYSITGLDSSSNVTVTAHTLIVNGNLRAVGTVAAVATTNTTVTDNIITLNQGETGAGVTAVYSGIEVDRGSLAKVALRWNETLHRWELSNDGSTYGPISTAVSPLIKVRDDPAPQLGGNLDVLAQTIFSSNNAVVKFDSNLSVKERTVNPSSITGYNTIYAKAAAGGGTGLYVTSQYVANQELVSKTKAIVYALIM
jgi:hypothetical protein